MHESRKVYVVNKSSHDFSKAEKFGNLVYMTRGRMNRFATNDMIRQFEDAMYDSKAEDFLLPCSLNVANILAAAVFVAKHKRLNLLLHKPTTGEYLERNHLFS